jgi:hypothetical protein
VQGVLRDSSGKLQSMMVSITVKVYDAQTMGTLLGTPAISVSVMATNGLFSLAVPVDDALKGALINASEAWLEVTAGNDTFPRQPLTSEVYAILAGAADGLSSNCSGCVVNAQIADKTIDVAKLAAAPGGKVGPFAGAALGLNDNAVHTLATISINAPGPGVVLAASTGYVGFYTHSNGTVDVMDCCLDTGAACGGGSLSDQVYHVPASWPTVVGGGADYNISWPLAMVGTVPVSAAGTVTVNLNCARSSGDGNGYFARQARLQAFFLPAQY